ncbi:MAG: insulinase family protein [Flavobacteriales bacterium]
MAAAVNGVLKEGTAQRSARELAEAIEYYGISLDHNVDRDHAWLAFYVLSDHLSSVLGLVREILTEAVFPQEELAHYIDQRKDELL